MFIGMRYTLGVGRYTLQAVGAVLMDENDGNYTTRLIITCVPVQESLYTFQHVKKTRYNVDEFFM